MFNHPLIAEKHRVALERSVMKHGSVNDEATVTKIYKAALEAYHADPKAKMKARPDPMLLMSRIEQGPLLLSTCTCAKTGLYVQLHGVSGSADLFMTFGQKFSIEQKDGVGNTGTVLW